MHEDMLIVCGSFQYWCHGSLRTDVMEVYGT